METFDHLECLSDLEPRPAADNRPKFPCGECGGTGRYAGHRVHQEKEHCFACRGAGFFRTSHQDRAKGRRQSADLKRRRETEAREAFDAEQPGLRKFLADAGMWSEFARSLGDHLAYRGDLTPNQIIAAESMRAKCEAGKAKRAAEKKAAPAGAYPNLARNFLSAAQQLKWPKLRIVTETGERIVLSRAGPNSRYPGHINMTDGRPFGEDTWYGRITPEGAATYSRNITDEAKATLAAFEANPDEAIKAQGLRTGECCCCGRELTDPVSIERGIGPICAGRWNI